MCRVWADTNPAKRISPQRAGGATGTENSPAQNSYDLSADRGLASFNAGPGNSKEVPGQGHPAHQDEDDRNGSAHEQKAKVIAMMKRPKGATLAEIVEATGWQKHTVRGFISLLGSKTGLTIESSKNAAGDRNYKLLK